RRLHDHHHAHRSLLSPRTSAHRPVEWGAGISTTLVRFSRMFRKCLPSVTLSAARVAYRRVVNRVLATPEPREESAMQRIAYIVFVGLVAVATLVPAAPASATLNACASAKKLCVAKAAAALLKCHSKNEKPPAGLDAAKFAACVQKARDQLDGGADPS